jgi:predicted metal-dependent hydrolase
LQNYPKAYIDFLVHFHTDRDYFECHEILEEYWKSVPSDAMSKAWTGLIQLAVALYHQRRGNLQGARKMLETAAANLTNERLKTLGIEAEALRDLIIHRIELLQESCPQYKDINIPIHDPKLLQMCVSACKEKSLRWGNPSNMDNIQLIDRHTLRDRSEVIWNRRKAKEYKDLKKR